MTITLSPELEEALNRQVECGRFATADEAVAAAVRALVESAGELVTARPPFDPGLAGAPEATRKALDYYDRALREKLEPLENGKYVAIHPESGDYEIRSRSGLAHRAMRARQPNGPIVVRNIGPADYGLLRRMHGERVA